ncbi:hypothetical protein NE571_12280 [Bacteroides sp. SL.2.06]|jgi:hypothetical protein|uniref:hypothetical protein n=1 Tax=Bacteroides sp. SL.2.06 TaxID=2965272 RepID=UPI00210EBE0B|nr:hypothetical protein [Bacteroides sp. SL.2.06]MCQ4810803.1 hypothetical protein [Bacteroides sp. SL.2.06]MCS3083691.1 hypothetical protein [Bacteroides ovatus]
MNITATNSTASTKVTDAIRIKYRISTRGTEAVKDITAEIIKDETTVGFFNASRNGVTGFSLHEDHGLTSEEVKKVFQTAIDDCSEVFK